MLEDIQPVAGEPRTPKVALILIKVDFDETSSEAAGGK